MTSYLTVDADNVTVLIFVDEDATSVCRIWSVLLPGELSQYPVFVTQKVTGKLSCSIQHHNNKVGGCDHVRVVLKFLGCSEEESKEEAEIDIETILGEEDFSDDEQDQKQEGFYFDTGMQKLRLTGNQLRC